MSKAVTRVQTGLRIEKRILKVLKGIKVPPFSEETLNKISQLKNVYDLDLIAADNLTLIEKGEET